MDVEKTIEFILNMQANAQVQMDKIREAQAQAEAREAASAERHESAHQRHDREIAEIRRTLARAVKLGVREARNSRKRHQELDEKITRLAASHLLTEEQLQQLWKKMDGFIDGLQRGGNGSH
ncbi:MAG: DUF465 domain-containing protein [Acidobacteriia bacterium]|nr:DUF465 domain-containing protein [Terriglobia bacterium]